MPWLLFVLFLSRVIIVYSMEGDFHSQWEPEIYSINIQRIVAKLCFINEF